MNHVPGLQTQTVYPTPFVLSLSACSLFRGDGGEPKLLRRKKTKWRRREERRHTPVQCLLEEPPYDELAHVTGACLCRLGLIWYGHGYGHVIDLYHVWMGKGPRGKRSGWSNERPRWMGGTKTIYPTTSLTVCTRHVEHLSTKR